MNDLPVEVRYLKVKWTDKFKPGTCEEYAEPCRLENLGNRMYEVETRAFPSVFPRKGGSILVGFHFPGLSPDEKPSITNGGRCSPFELVGDSGRHWWVFLGGWRNQRHESPFFNRVGRATVKAGDINLNVVNDVANFTVEELEQMLEDFHEGLVNLILSNESAVKARVLSVATLSSGVGEETVNAIRSFLDATERVIRNPVKELVEDEAVLARSRVKPVRNTFREYSVNPGADEFTSRVHRESLSTRENEYVHFLLRNVIAFLRNAIKTVFILPDRLERSQGLIEKMADSCMTVNKEIFEKEFEDKFERRRLEQEAFVGYEAGLKRTLGEIFHEGGRAKGLPYRFLGLGGNPLSVQVRDARDGFEVLDEDNVLSVLKEENRASRRCLEILQECIDQSSKRRVVLKLRGEVRRTPDGRVYFRDCDPSSVHIQVGIKDLEDLKKLHEKKRSELEERGWKQKKDKSINEYINLLRKSWSDLSRRKKYAKAQKGILRALFNRALDMEDFFIRHDISVSSRHPFSMVMSMNDDYSEVESSFSRIVADADVTKDMLEQVFSMKERGVVEVWNVYEKWCLVKIISTLISLRFIPESGWKEKLFDKLIRRDGRRFDQEDVVITFRHAQDCDLTLRLRYDSSYETNAGTKFPDFVLQIDQSEYGTISEFVMDAKFKDWNEPELLKVLAELNDEKDYGRSKTVPVFILHPKAHVVSRRISPLEWGFDCDYGGWNQHQCGHVLLTPAVEYAGASELNLQRLLVMFLQMARVNHCPSCGGILKQKQKKGNKWHCPFCGSLVILSHCFSCRTSIYKNGLFWTYHLTRAESPYNVKCSACGSHFVNNDSLRDWM